MAFLSHWNYTIFCLGTIFAFKLTLSRNRDSWGRLAQKEKKRNTEMLKLKSTLLAFLFGIASLSLSPNPASAALLLVNASGQLTGAQNVNVLGTPYDVSFVDGTCVSVFGGCDGISDFDFSTESIASAAAQALLDQVFLDTGAGDFDSDPSLTSGCVFADFCDALIPFGIPIGKIGVRVTLVIATNWLGSVTDLVAGPAQVGIGFDTSFAARSTYARFSQVVAVPEPSTLLLFGVGLAGLAGFGRRRRQD